MDIAVDIGGTAIKIARIDADASSSPSTIVTRPTPDDINEISDRIIMVRPVFGQAAGLVGAGIAAGSLLGNVAREVTR